MVDLKANPFYLNDDQIRWVEDTLGGMTLEEKLGQIFILLKGKPGVNEAEIKEIVTKYGQGGHRWQGGNKEAAFEQNYLYQKYSKYPLLIAANCDEGGNGCLPEGTFVATAAEAGAGEGTDNAYHTGLVAGREASAIGVNWMFNPIVDLYRNWRNSIVNTRSFGGDAQKVLDNARAYIKGIKDANPNMACTIKHFPGDGIDELDPHLAMAINDMSAEEWRKTSGMVYKPLIDEGVESIMIGQIACPAMTREYKPTITDAEIMPATLDPVLLQDVLRGELGFNGLIVSDASHMIGMTAMMSRKEAVPLAIAAGCDMFLFCNDVEEDMGYLKAGLDSGLVSEERFNDALLRILGLKAKLHLYDDSVRFAKKEALDQVGCQDHHAFTRQAADQCVTLVKDTKHYLPWDVKNKKRALLVYNYTTPNSKAFSGDPTRDLVTKELKAAGFEVTQAPNFYELECQSVNPFNFVKMMTMDPRETFKEKFDLVFLFTNVTGHTQTHTMRVNWSSSHSCEMPWYVSEVPTIAVSLNYTNHLIDLAQVHTYINAYGSREENVHAVVEKIIGKSEFKGKAEDTVFCGRWEARL